ncbi:MAG: hypothetical protein WBD99_10755 [Thermodesulfobacteriota bacterium]
MNGYMEVWVEDIDEDLDESLLFPEESHYEATREALSPEYHDLSWQEIETLLEDVLEGMSPDVT